MKQKTKAELAAECERLRKQNDVLSHALVILAQRDKPDAQETVRGSDRGERYTYAAYHCTAPHGGILIVTFRYPGQHDQVEAYYLDDFARDNQSSLVLDVKCAIERIRARARELQLAKWQS